MLGLYDMPWGSAHLISEQELEGMVFNTPVPYYDIGISCGNPVDSGDVLPVFMMMPDEVVGFNDVFCTRAEGTSMIGVGIMPGDLLVIERVEAYYSHDIVLAEIDGERLLKTYYVDENGDQWLVPANRKFHSIKLDGSKRVRFCGKLRNHLRQSPRQSMESIAESIGEARAMMKQDFVCSEEFKRLVIKPECADKVVARLHELMDGRMKPKDIMMPLRAAMEAGAIRRPTWAEFIAEFGSKRTSKGTLSDYTDTTKEKYVGEPQFQPIIEEFRQFAL